MIEVTDFQRGFFQENGYVVFKGLLSKKEVENCLLESERLEKYISECKDKSKDFSFDAIKEDVLRAVFNVRKYSNYFLTMPCKKQITKMIKEINNAYKKSNMIGSIFWYKKAFIGSAQPWHQDLAYHVEFKKKYDFGVNLWIALDKAEQNNGCLQILPKSHQLGLVDHNKWKNQLGREVIEIDINKSFPNSLPLYMELNPGDAVLFNWMCAHCSDINRSDNPRRAVSYGFLLRK